jgi:hypothetical protein
MKCIIVDIDLYQTGQVCEWSAAKWPSKIRVGSRK